MSESEPIDDRLRRALAAESVPTLSPAFEQRLTDRLRPRRLSPRSRRFLYGYSVVGTGVSLSAMHSSGMDWRVGSVSTLISLVIAGLILRGYFSPAAARQSKRARKPAGSG